MNNVLKQRIQRSMETTMIRSRIKKRQSFTIEITNEESTDPKFLLSVIQYVQLAFGYDQSVCFKNSLVFSKNM